MSNLAQLLHRSKAFLTWGKLHFDSKVVKKFLKPGMKMLTKLEVLSVMFSFSCNKWKSLWGFLASSSHSLRLWDSFFFLLSFLFCYLIFVCAEIHWFINLAFWKCWQVFLRWPGTYPWKYATLISCHLIFYGWFKTWCWIFVQC